MTTSSPSFALVTIADRRTYWVGGQCQALIAGANETGGRYALSHSTIAVGGGAAQHRHGREAEAFYVLSGQLHFSVVGEPTMNLLPGTFLHLEPGLDYRFEAVGPAPAEVLILYAPAGLERLIEAAGIADPADSEGSRHAAVRSVEEAETLKAAARAYGVIYARSPKP
ncbi:MAG: cupin domain-containing protein [Alphaproteobacteria bacterium]|nr:cupin domain-containing protein [Alphaproteobacteria bacterium]